MNRVIKYTFLTILLFPLLGFFFKLGINYKNVFASEDTCPSGGGWTKIDSNVLSSYPVAGATAYCFKAGSEHSEGCEGGIFNFIPAGGFGNNDFCGLSHWSYYIPTTTMTPTATPTSTPTGTPHCSHTPRPTCTPTGTATPTATPESPTPTPTVPPEFTPTPTPSEPPRGGDGGGGGGAPQCTDPKPNTPYLVSAVAEGANSVRVTWQPVLGSVTDYSIVYGPSSGNYLYSVVSTGNVDSFLINGLTGGCFAVRAVNNCMPGDLSNEVCSGAVAGQVLGASTMGATGTFTDNLFYLIFILGSLFTSFGVRKIAAKRVR